MGLILNVRHFYFNYVMYFNKDVKLKTTYEIKG